MSKKGKVIEKKKSPQEFLPSKNFDRWALLILILIPLLLYREFLTGEKMLFGTDWLLGGLPNRHFMAQFIKTNWQIAQWFPHIYSGLPTVAGFFADLFYPTTLLRLFIPTHIVWTYTFIFHLFLAGLGTFLFLKELELNPIFALLGGIGYSLAGSLVSLTYAGHEGRLIVSALLPLILYFLHKGIKRQQLSWFIFSGTLVVMQLFSGHVQKVYYTGLIILAYFIYQLFSRKEAKKFRLLLYFFITALYVILFAAIQYLPIYGNMPYAARGEARGYEFATSWSMPPEEVFDLITPNFSGGLKNYWGRNPFKLHSEYFGLLFIILALITIIFFFKKSLVKFFAFYTLFGFLMAFGGHTPFYYLPYYLIPGVDKFRGPSMIFFTAVFSLIVLAGLGLNYIYQIAKENELRKLKRFFVYSSLTLALILFLALVAKETVISLLLSIGKITEQEKITNLHNNYQNLLTGLLLANILWWINSFLLYNLAQRRLKVLTFAAIAGLILLFDVGRNNFQYIKSAEHPAVLYAPDEVVNFLKNDKGLYRVHPIYYKHSDDGLLTYHNIQSTGGHHPNPLQSYQDFIGTPKTVLFRNPPQLLKKNFLSLLSVKYIVVPNLPEDISGFDAQTQSIIAELRFFLNQNYLRPVFVGKEHSIYENTAFLPKAFLVPNYMVIKEKEQIFEMLKSDTFQPTRSVILSQAFNGMEKERPVDTIIGEAKVLKYTANEILLEVENHQAAFLVLSENYHPDWKAEANKKRLEVYRAFHTLRAVYLPAGRHKVRFYYDSKYYKLGRFLSLIAGLFLLLNIFSLRKKPKAKGS